MTADEPISPSKEQGLVCVECGAQSVSAHGWRAFLTIDEAVATYCPDCAREEFGDA